MAFKKLLKVWAGVTTVHSNHLGGEGASGNVISSFCPFVYTYIEHQSMHSGVDQLSTCPSAGIQGYKALEWTPIATRFTLAHVQAGNEASIGVLLTGSNWPAMFLVVHAGYSYSIHS